jgi:hypothetical protein
MTPVIAQRAKFGLDPDAFMVPMQLTGRQPDFFTPRPRFCRIRAVERTLFKV